MFDARALIATKPRLESQSQSKRCSNCKYWGSRAEWANRDDLNLKTCGSPLIVYGYGGLPNGPMSCMFPSCGGRGPSYKPKPIVPPPDGGNCVILAGGAGSRLRSVVSDRPKVMADVTGRPFLTYVLDRLIRQSVDRVTLCVGYRANWVRDYFGSCYKNISITYSQEFRPMGTAGALRLALNDADPSEAVLVMNGDSYCEFSVAKMRSQHLLTRAIATILVTPVMDVGRYGEVRMTGLEIDSFKEKNGKKRPGLINAGAYLIEGRVLTEQSGSSMEKDIIPSLLGRGLYGHIGGRFLDIGTPESYATAPAFFAK